MTLTLTARWDGQALWPTSNQKELQAIKPGPVKLVVKRVRSVEHHRLFFAVLAKAYENWPETEDFRPDGVEHLRSWALCKAGHRESQAFDFLAVLEDPASLDTVIQIVTSLAMMIAQRGSHCFVKPHKGGVYIHWPKSIAFENLPQSEFGKISDSVFDVLSNVIGTDVVALVTEAERGAA